jgi:hypothetical protein
MHIATYMESSMCACLYTNPYINTYIHAHTHNSCSPGTYEKAVGSILEIWLFPKFLAICIYIYINMYTYIHIYIYVHIGMYTFMVWTCIHYMYVHCMYVSMYVRIYAHTWKHIIYTHAHTYTYMDNHFQKTHEYTHIHTYSCMHACMHACMYVACNVRIHAHAHMYIYKYAARKSWYDTYITREYICLFVYTFTYAYTKPRLHIHTHTLVRDQHHSKKFGGSSWISLSLRSLHVCNVPICMYACLCICARIYVCV